MYFCKRSEWFYDYSYYDDRIIHCIIKIFEILSYPTIANRIKNCVLAIYQNDQYLVYINGNTYIDPGF